MTLVNVQVGCDSVFFLTDTAAINKRGVLKQRRQKISYHPHLDAAVVVTGNVGHSRDIDTVMAGYRSQPEMLDNIAKHVRHVRHWRTFAGNFHVLVGYVDDDGKGRAFVVTTGKGDGIEPYTVHPIEDCIFQPAIEDERLVDEVTDEWMDNPYTPRRLVQHQRTHPLSYGPGLGYIVGGNIILSRLSKNGMETSVVERYADEIGKPLDGRVITAPV